MAKEKLSYILLRSSNFPEKKFYFYTVYLHSCPGSLFIWPNFTLKPRKLLLSTNYCYYLSYYEKNGQVYRTVHLLVSISVQNLSSVHQRKVWIFLPLSDNHNSDIIVCVCRKKNVSMIFKVCLSKTRPHVKQMILLLESKYCQTLKRSQYLDKNQH